MEEIVPPCNSSTPNFNISGEYCEPILDNFNQCWPASGANETISMPCVDILKHELSHLREPLVAHIGIAQQAVAFRECNAEGVWTHGNWTNYTMCSELVATLEKVAPGSLRSILSHVAFAGSLISFIFLAISLFIFCYFRCLHCSRLSVHKNLIVALMLTNVMMLVIAEPYITQRAGATYRDVDWVCKTVLSLQMYARLASILWMWNEGFFLHSRITVSVFDSKAPFKFLHCMGWGLPVVLTCTWAVCTQNLLPTACWHGYAQSDTVWIIVGPIIAALGINMLFFINIIRILVTRLQNNRTMEMEKIRKAIKAAAILFPLLGITNLFFFIRPSGSGVGFLAYLIVNSLLQSGQGILVAIIYCFLNAEVRAAIRKHYDRMMVTRQPSRWSRKESARTSTMMMSMSDRRNSRPARGLLSTAMPANAAASPKLMTLNETEM